MKIESDDEKISNLIFPKGTQIVTLIKSKVLSADRFEPRGTVGIVKSQPSDASHAYLIEFLDGSISAIKRNKFAIRKHYQTNFVANSLKG